MEEPFPTELLMTENSGSDASLTEHWREKYSVIRLDYRKRMGGITRALKEMDRDKRRQLADDIMYDSNGRFSVLRNKASSPSAKEQKITALARQVEELFRKRFSEHGIAYSNGYTAGLANRSSPRTLPPHQKKISRKLRDRLSELGIYENNFPGYNAGLSKCYNY
jgi:hypothetical protein